MSGMHGADDLVMSFGDFNEHIGSHIDGFDWVHGGYGVGKRNLEGTVLLGFCQLKELCMSNTWFKRVEMRKGTFRRAKLTKIGFVLKKKGHQRFLRYGKVIPGRCQHTLVVEDIDREKIRNVVRKTYTERNERIIC